MRFCEKLWLVETWNLVVAPLTIAFVVVPSPKQHYGVARLAGILFQLGTQCSSEHVHGTHTFDEFAWLTLEGEKQKYILAVKWGFPTKPQ